MEEGINDRVGPYRGLQGCMFMGGDRIGDIVTSRYTSPVQAIWANVDFWLVDDKWRIKNHSMDY